MADIELVEQDANYLRVSAEPAIIEELFEFFSFEQPNFQAIRAKAPRLKKWNGEVHLLTKKGKRLYRGLESYIRVFASDRKYTVQSFLTSFPPVAPETLSGFLGVNPAPFTLYPEQMAILSHCSASRRALVLLPTAGGKSVCMYYLARLFHEKVHPGQKVLIVEPTIGLVTQIASDFKEYSIKNGWNAEANTYRIYEGLSHEHREPIAISTWQSVYNDPKKFFARYGTIIVDEAHMLSAQALRGIFHKAPNCQNRFGFTGTLSESECNKLIIEGLTGPSYRITTTRQMIDEGKLSKLKIKSVVLIHKPSQRFKTYSDELSYLAMNENRNRLICQMAEMQGRKNVLIISALIDKNVVPLYEMLKQHHERTFAVYGDTPANEREVIRKYAEKHDSVRLIASYGTYQLGTNIKNLQTIITATNGKSIIRVLQTIGRGLRLDDKENELTIVDIADYLNQMAFSWRHFKRRIQIYKEERFPVEMREVEFRSE